MERTTVYDDVKFPKAVANESLKLLRRECGGASPHWIELKVEHGKTSLGFDDIDELWDAYAEEVDAAILVEAFRDYDGKNPYKYSFSLRFRRDSSTISISADDKELITQAFRFFDESEEDYRRQEAQNIIGTHQRDVSAPIVLRETDLDELTTEIAKFAEFPKLSATFLDNIERDFPNLPSFIEFSKDSRIKEIEFDASTPFPGRRRVHIRLRHRLTSEWTCRVRAVGPDKDALDFVNKTESWVKNKKPWYTFFFSKPMGIFWWLLTVIPWAVFFRVLDGSEVTPVLAVLSLSIGLILLGRMFLVPHWVPYGVLAIGQGSKVYEDRLKQAGAISFIVATGLGAALGIASLV